MENSSFLFHLFKKPCSGVRCKNMKSAGGQRIFNSPFHCLGENRSVILIQPKNKTSVYHYAKTVQSPDRFIVIFADVLLLITLCEVAIIQCFKTNKHTA